MIFSEIMPLPPGKQTTSIYFNEKNGTLGVSAMIDPRIIRSRFENTVNRSRAAGGGIYGAYYTSKPPPQKGFIPITWQQRRDYASLLSPPILSGVLNNTTTSIFDKKLTSSDIGISDHASILTEKDIPNVGVRISSENYSSQAEQYYRDRRATVDIISSYYTIQQETRSYPNLTSWNFDASTMCWIYLGRTNNKLNESQNNETGIYTIDVPTHHEISFILYSGNNKVYSGKTPIRLIHLHPKAEYKVIWVSNKGNKERKFIVGYRGYELAGYHIIFLD